MPATAGSLYTHRHPPIITAAFVTSYALNVMSLSRARSRVVRLSARSVGSKNVLQLLPGTATPNLVAAFSKAALK